MQMPHISSGLLIRAEGLVATAVVFNLAEGTVSLAGASRGNQFGIVFNHYDTVNRPLARGAAYPVRVLARDEFVEVYLDDDLLFSASQRNHARQGSLGFALMGEIVVAGNRVASLRPITNGGGTQ